MATAVRKRSRKSGAKKALLQEVGEALELELDEEKLDDELKDELDELEEASGAKAESKVRKLSEGESGLPEKEEKPKAKKKECIWVVGHLVREKHGDRALGCYLPTAPFRSSPARNEAFRALQDAGVKGLPPEEWISETATRFEDQGVNGTAKGAVGFIRKAVRRVVIGKLPGGNLVVVEPLPNGGYLRFRKDGQPMKASAAAKPAAKKSGSTRRSK